MEELLLAVGDGAGAQDVLALWREQGSRAGVSSCPQPEGLGVSWKCSGCSVEMF